jgi:anion-transporting  ArsA/GET3 family ATPase
VNVPELLAGKRICVCAGSGGVGKTTTAAVIGLGMAARGLKVAVVTIDPAKRLANALGLEELSSEPERIDPARLGVELSGELWAMMLDPKRTFDELIERIAPSPERAEAIKANRIYHELSTAVAGSQEFTAVSKLHELAADGDWDLLVLDTPPSRNALEFLDAPGRLTGFLDGRALQVFLRPTGIGMRLLGTGAGPLLGALRRVTGVDLVADITTFLGLLGGMTDVFSRRAREVDAMLRSEASTFILVCSAGARQVDEAIWFHRTLREMGLPLAGAVINRFHHESAGRGSEEDLLSSLSETVGDGDLAARIVENLADYRVLAARDAASLQRLAHEFGEGPLLPVPQFDDDIHDIRGLLRVHEYLFGTEEVRRRLIEDLVA